MTLDTDLPVWTFDVNWGNVVTETLEFKTDILTSDAGTEQRRELRLSPRRMFEFAVTVIGAERTMFDLAVISAGGSEWMFPVAPHGTLLMSPMTAAGKIIYTDTRGREYKPGDLVLLRLGPLNYATGRIQTVFDDQLVLTAATGAAWPAGTAVYPLRRGRFTDQPTAGRQNDVAFTSQVRFRITTANDLPVGYPTAGIVETYKNRMVLSTQPNESSKLDYGYSRMLQDLDNQTGIVTVVDTAQEAFPTQQFTWFLQGRTARMSFRAFLYALAGRQHSFWVPTFASDLELTSDAAQGDNTIVVETCGYTAFSGAVNARRFARIALDDGSGICIQIVGSAYTDATKNYEVLTLAEPLSSPINVSRVRMTSFLNLVRLDQDSIEIAHVTDLDGLATCQVVLRGLSVSELDVGEASGFGYNFGLDFGVAV